MRIKIIRVVIIFLFLVIALDLLYVQVIRGRYYHNLSANNRIRIVPLEGWRGRIKDRNDTVLADRRISYNVMVAPQDILSREKLFQFLSDVLKIDKEVILRRYAQKKSAPFAPVVVAADIDRNKAIMLEENKYIYPGLIIQEGFRRSYPLGKNSAHILGYVGTINRAKREKFKKYGYSAQSIIGYSGVEEFYDSYLNGVEGGLQIEVNSRGQQVRLLSLKEPTKGQDITLTIDSDLQGISDKLLEDRTGVIIVMDMENGEILGMTSSPSYDPNFFVDENRNKKRMQFFADTSAPLLNRGIKGAFPPGSVFKIPVALGALDAHKIKTQTTYVCTGYYKLGGSRFRCAHTHGPQNLIEAIAHSCNVYFYQTGLAIGAETIHQYAHQMGLGNLTYVDLPYEKSGHIPNPQQRSYRGRKWYPGDTLNFSIGQGGVLVTPLQLVRMMGTIGNDGVEVQPHVIKAVEDMPFEGYSLKQRLKIDPAAIDVVQKGMRAAVTDFSGTARVLNLDQLFVAGKTGTAQTSGNKKSHAWFVGYAKGLKKKVAFCVFLEHGGSSYNACLLARQLLLGMQKMEIL